MRRGGADPGNELSLGRRDEGCERVPDREHHPGGALKGELTDDGGRLIQMELAHDANDGFSPRSGERLPVHPRTLHVPVAPRDAAH